MPMSAIFDLETASLPDPGDRSAVAGKHGCIQLCGYRYAKQPACGGVKLDRIGARAGYQTPGLLNARG